MEIDLFNVTDIFYDIKIATSSDIGNLKNGFTTFIGRTNTRNGLQGFVEVKKSKINKGNCITISMVGTNIACYQKNHFTCSQNILILRCKYLNSLNGIYIATILNKYLLTKGFGYGHPVSLKRFKKSSIPLPIDSQGKPDYAFMEQFMRQKEQEKIEKFQNYITKRIEQVKDFKDVEPLNQKEWGEFFLEDVFNIKAGKRLTKADMKKGSTPFIGASDSNNGITNFVSNINSSLDSNILGVNYNGSVVENFYHPYKAIFSDDVKRLSLKELDGNEFLYLFTKTIILKQKSKFRYAYKFNEERMLRQKLLFPINKSNQPDYNYMENYIKKLEYTKLLKYLTLKKRKTLTN